MTLASVTSRKGVQRGGQGEREKGAGDEEGRSNGKRKRKREDNRGDSLVAASVSGLAFCDPLSRSMLRRARKPMQIVPGVDRSAFLAIQCDRDRSNPVELADPLYLKSCEIFGEQVLTDYGFVQLIGVEFYSVFVISRVRHHVI